MVEQDTTRFTAGIEIRSSLSSLQFTLAGKRYIDHFGGTTLSSPSVFWDPRRTHPDLELRLLSIMGALDPGSQPLLDDFLQRRAQKRDPVLWRAPGLSLPQTAQP